MPQEEKIMPQEEKNMPQEEKNISDEARRRRYEEHKRQFAEFLARERKRQVWARTFGYISLILFLISAPFALYFLICRPKDWGGYGPLAGCLFACFPVYGLIAVELGGYIDDKRDGLR